jgi:hypothetical protein
MSVSIVQSTKLFFDIVHNREHVQWPHYALHCTYSWTRELGRFSEPCVCGELRIRDCDWDNSRVFWSCESNSSTGKSIYTPFDQ